MCLIKAYSSILFILTFWILLLFIVLVSQLWTSETPTCPWAWGEERKFSYPVFIANSTISFGFQSQSSDVPLHPSIVEGRPTCPDWRHISYINGEHSRSKYSEFNNQKLLASPWVMSTSMETRTSFNACIPASAPLSCLFSIWVAKSESMHWSGFVCWKQSLSFLIFRICSRELPDNIRTYSVNTKLHWYKTFLNGHNEFYCRGIWKLLGRQGHYLETIIIAKDL